MKRYYIQIEVDVEDIADNIMEWEKVVGAVITIDYIERFNPTSVGEKTRRIVFHYDKED